MTIQKKILFLVNAGAKIGLGHFYRSLALALALKEKGHEVVFLHLPSEFWSEQVDFPFKHVELIAQDFEKQIINVCREEKANILYVDGIILFSEECINEVKRATKVVFYQNLSDSRYLSDVFILPSIHQEETFFEPFHQSDTRIFKGLEYFTFNKEIERFTPKIFTKNVSIQKIAITAGGSDPKNILLSLYDWLDEEMVNIFSFTFFFGKDYVYKDKIPSKLKNNTVFSLYNIADILSHDIVIAAFGVSAYEFMYLGIPVIGIGHQKSNADALKIVAAKTGAIYNLGLVDDLKKPSFLATLQAFKNNPAFLQNQTEKAKKILDLRGVDRVVHIIENL